MEFTSVRQFLRGKTTLVTGATGFLAKVFVEKLLRIQSDLKRLHLLLRASDTDTAKRRMHDEIIRKNLFRVLRDKWGRDFDSFISDKVVAVPGDVLHENLGLSDANFEILCQEIDVIVNTSAAINFDERYVPNTNVN